MTEVIEVICFCFSDQSQKPVQKTCPFSWILGFLDASFQGIFPSTKSTIILWPSPYDVVQALCIVLEPVNPERRIERAY